MLPLGFLVLSSILFNQPRKTNSENKIDPMLQSKITINEDNIEPVIISIKDMEDSDSEELIKRISKKIKYKLPIINAFAVNMKLKDLKDICKCPNVRFIHYDADVEAFLDIGAKTVKADKAWESNFKGKGVTVAVVDTGIYPHPDLTTPNNRIIAFKDFVNKHTEPYDDNGHGTHVSGEIAGNGLYSNGKYKGIAPEANLVGVKVLDKSGNGNISDVIAGLQWVIEKKDKYGIKVVNMSLGAPPKSLMLDPLVSAVNSLWSSGITVVCAAGNSGPEPKTIRSPGISPKILTVGASDDRKTSGVNDDIIADFSSRGPTPDGNQKPDVVAPGVSIMSLNSDKSYIPNTKNYKSTLDDFYVEKSGTSMATPIAAGACALLFEKYPNLTPDQVKQIVKNTAVSLKTAATAQGKGMINIESMLNYQNNQNDQNQTKKDTSADKPKAKKCFWWPFFC